MKLLRHRLVAGLVAALSGGAASSALCFLLLQVDSVSLVGRGLVRTLDFDPGPYLPWVGMFLPLACLRARDRGKALARFARAALPWLALLPLEFLPPSLVRVALSVFVLGWGAFRFGHLYGPVLPEQPVAPRKGALIVCLIWAACALYGYWSQFEAHITLFFIYGDWSQYAEHYLALLSGEAPGRAWLAGAGHFNPLVNLVMAGCLALVRRPETIFLVNALLVSSAVPLAAALARKRGASPQIALCAALPAAGPGVRRSRTRSADQPSSVPEVPSSHTAPAISASTTIPITYFIFRPFHAGIARFSLTGALFAR